MKIWTLILKSGVKEINQLGEFIIFSECLNDVGKKLTGFQVALLIMWVWKSVEQ